MKKTFIHAGISAFALCLAVPSYGQRLQAAGVSGSFHVARLHTGQREFQLGTVAIDPQADQNNDETGNGVTLFGRWQVGRGGWYAQPELGYVSTLETPVGLTYSSGSFSYSGRPIRHLDARLLGGYQSGPLRLFAGPSVGYFMRNSIYRNFTNAEVQAVATALDADLSRVQVAMQAGAGVSIWRLDVNARYEWGLTRYSNTVQFQQDSYSFGRTLQQLILEVGFQLYKRPDQPGL